MSQPGVLKLKSLSWLKEGAMCRLDQRRLLTTLQAAKLHEDPFHILV